jgi:hypothetical protein
MSRKAFCSAKHFQFTIITNKSEQNLSLTTLTVTVLNSTFAYDILKANPIIFNVICISLSAV